MVLQVEKISTINYINLSLYNLKSHVADRRFVISEIVAPRGKDLNGALPPPRRPAPLRLLTGGRKWRPPMCSVPGQSPPSPSYGPVPHTRPASTYPLPRAPRRHLHSPAQPNTQTQLLILSKFLCLPFDFNSDIVLLVIPQHFYF